MRRGRRTDRFKHHPTPKSIREQNPADFSSPIKSRKDQNSPTQDQLMSPPQAMNSVPSNKDNLGESPEYILNELPNDLNNPTHDESYNFDYVETDSMLASDTQFIDCDNIADFVMNPPDIFEKEDKANHYRQSGEFGELLDDIELKENMKVASNLTIFLSFFEFLIRILFFSHVFPSNLSQISLFSSIFIIKIDFFQPLGLMEKRNREDDFDGFQDGPGKLQDYEERGTGVTFKQQTPLQDNLLQNRLVDAERNLDMEKARRADMESENHRLRSMVEDLRHKLSLQDEYSGGNDNQEMQALREQIMDLQRDNNRLRADLE